MKKYTYSMGDASKVIYGGFLVDTKGNAIFWREPDYDTPDVTEPLTKCPECKAKITLKTRCKVCGNKNIYPTIPCYRFTVESDVIADLTWIESEDWQAIANFADMQNYKELATSKDISERAFVYEMVGQYYGFENLDGNPENYTYKELCAMYPRKKSVKK